MKAHNNAYDGHAQQKLGTPHIQDRCEVYSLL